MTTNSGVMVTKVCKICHLEFTNFEEAAALDYCDACFCVLLCIVNKTDHYIHYTTPEQQAAVQRAMNEWIDANL